jgi:hypothetical protein
MPVFKTCTSKRRHARARRFAVMGVIMRGSAMRSRKPRRATGQKWSKVDPDNLIA